jgi:hypothetical protein
VPGSFCYLEDQALRIPRIPVVYISTVSGLMSSRELDGEKNLSCKALVDRKLVLTGGRKRNEFRSTSGDLAERLLQGLLLLIGRMGPMGSMIKAGRNCYGTGLMKTGTGTATNRGLNQAAVQPIAEPVPVFIRPARATRFASTERRWVARPLRHGRGRIAKQPRPSPGAQGRATRFASSTSIWQGYDQGPIRRNPTASLSQPAHVATDPH